MSNRSTTGAGSGDALQERRWCSRRVLRYLLARYEDPACWGPFRGPSSGRMPRTMKPKPLNLADESDFAATPSSKGGPAKTGEQIRPVLDSIRRFNLPFRDDEVAPPFQFHLISLLALLTAISVGMAAVTQQGQLAAAAGVALALLALLYYRFRRQNG